MAPAPPPEATALLALMLLHDSRRAARLDDAGNLVVLEEQDRSRWNQAQIAEALPLVEEALRRGPGPYALQAAIAALHCQAARAGDTDWAQIVQLYDVLERLQPSRGRARGARRAGPLSPPALRARRSAAAARPADRGGGELHPGARARDERRGAPLPRAAAAGGRRTGVIRQSRASRLHQHATGGAVTMMTVVTHVTLKEGAAPRWDAVMRERLGAARSQPGWIAAQLLIPLDGLNRRLIVGTWQTRADWEAWHEDVAFEETRRELADLEAVDSEVWWHETIVDIRSEAEPRRAQAA
jgi:heme-degrading monooxygenase HmoA